jgi:hypothetical protein
MEPESLSAGRRSKKDKRSQCRAPLKVAWAISLRPHRERMAWADGRGEAA